MTMQQQTEEGVFGLHWGLWSFYRYTHISSANDALSARCSDDDFLFRSDDEAGVRNIELGVVFLGGNQILILRHTSSTRV